MLYFAFAENSKDVKKLLSWFKRRHIENYQIICLSLGAWEFLCQSSGRGKHIWSLLDMEELIDKAFVESEKLIDKWSGCSGPNETRSYDISLKHRLHFEFMHHAATCQYVAEALLSLWAKDEYQVVLPGSSLVFLGPYYPEIQSNVGNNFLFKDIVSKIFLDAGIKVQCISFVEKIRQATLPLSLYWRIIKTLLDDLVTFMFGRFIYHCKFNKTANSLLASVDILSSGWGKDLSRMLSLAKWKEEITKKKLTVVNLIWRPQKLKGEDRNVVSNSNFYNINVKEKIKAGVSFGPSLSLFSFSSFKKYLFFLKNVVGVKLNHIFNFNKQNDLFLLRCFGLRYNLAYNIFFGYREHFITQEILKVVLTRCRPKFFLGSDSVSISSRSELLMARDCGVVSFSTPHSYQVYSMTPYAYLADYTLTFGEESRAALVESGLQSESVLSIGVNHQRFIGWRKINPQKVKVVIGTRSWGGLWSNFGSRQDIYYTYISEFLQATVQQPNIEVVIKSHPNGDFHEYYDLLEKKFNDSRIRHIKSGWRVDSFSENMDILICFGDTPSFYFSVFYLQIPVVLITGTMTKTQERLCYHYNKTNAVADYNQAIEVVLKLINNEDYYKNFMERQNSFAERLGGDTPEKKLADIFKTNI